MGWFSLSCPYSIQYSQDWKCNHLTLRDKSILLGKLRFLVSFLRGTRISRGVRALTALESGRADSDPQAPAGPTVYHHVIRQPRVHTAQRSAFTAYLGRTSSGILTARLFVATLFLAMFSHCAYSLTCAWLSATPWTAACQAPLPMGFSRQEDWSGLPCPPPGDLPNPGSNQVFHIAGDSLPSAPPGN